MQNKKDTIKLLSQYISVAYVPETIKKVGKELSTVINSSDNHFIIDSEFSVFSNDICYKNDFSHLVQSLIRHDNSEFNYITLLAPNIEDTEDIFEQIPLSFGTISNDELAISVYDFELINEETDSRYSLEEIIEYGPYLILLEFFTLRKDKHSIKIGEY